MPRAVYASFILLLLLVPTASAEPIVRAWMEAYDIADQPITSIEVGQPFTLRAYVEDLRDPHAGVPAAFLASSFDPTRVSTNGPLLIDDFFADFLPLNVVDSSALAGGGIALITRPENLPPSGGQLLFSVPLLATGLGIALFNPSFAVRDDNDWFVFFDDLPVPPEQIELVGLQLSIVPEPSSILLTGIASAVLGLVAVRCRRSC